FPSVQFGHVTSPLSPRTTWSMFFTELAQRTASDTSAFGNRHVAQQLAMNSVEPGQPISLGAIPTGEGVDVHYQSIGKRTLADGDSLALSVAHGSATYQRIVEWRIPDNRNEHGQYTGPRRGDDEDEPQPDAAWDALRFKNPLPFPMTT